MQATGINQKFIQFALFFLSYIQLLNNLNVIIMTKYIRAIYCLIQGAKVALIILISVLILPFPASSTALIHTIQTGSFLRQADARKQFDYLVQQLSENERDHLRIEVIGKFHSVRLGKFNTKSEADRFFRTVSPRIGQSIVLKAYYKKERIVARYEPVITKDVRAEEISVEEKIPPESKTEKPVLAKLADDAELKPVEEQILLLSDLVEKSNYDQALEVIKKEISLHPEVPEINGWYGTILLKLEKPREALTYLQKAAALSPGVPDYHNGIAYCFYYLNRHNDAVDEFSKAIMLNPSYVDALTGLGITYSTLGEKEKAMDAYRKLKGLDSTSAEKLLRIINEVQS